LGFKKILAKYQKVCYNYISKHKKIYMTTNTFADGFPQTPLEAINFSYFLEDKQEWFDWLKTANAEEQSELVSILHNMWIDEQANVVPDSLNKPQESPPEMPSFKFEEEKVSEPVFEELPKMYEKPLEETPEMPDFEANPVFSPNEKFQRINSEEIVEPAKEQEVEEETNSETIKEDEISENIEEEKDYLDFSFEEESNLDANEENSIDLDDDESEVIEQEVEEKLEPVDYNPEIYNNLKNNLSKVENFETQEISSNFASLLSNYNSQTAINNQAFANILEAIYDEQQAFVETIKAQQQNSIAILNSSISSIAGLSNNIQALYEKVQELEQGLMDINSTVITHSQNYTAQERTNLDFQDKFVEIQYGRDKTDQTISIFRARINQDLDKIHQQIAGNNVDIYKQEGGEIKKALEVLTQQVAVLRSQKPHQANTLQELKNKHN
jgi:hypothetical protein